MASSSLKTAAPLIFLYVQNPSNLINKFKFISGGSSDGANCNLYTPKSKNLKKIYYLGAKAWNCLPTGI